MLAFDREIHSLIGEDFKIWKKVWSFLPFPLRIRRCILVCLLLANHATSGKFHFFKPKTKWFAFLRVQFAFQSPIASTQGLCFSLCPIACENSACTAWAASLVPLVLSAIVIPAVRKFQLICNFLQDFFEAFFYFDPTFLLTLATLAFPAFWGVNAGFPWAEWRKGLWSRRSPWPLPEARRRSEWENHVIENADLLLAILVELL